MIGSRREHNHVVLQPRDRHLLKELETLRVVDRDQAMRFAPFHSVTRANARLLALTRAGYLRRFFAGTIAGGRRAIYTLPNRRLGSAARDPLARERQLFHQLSLNDLYCRLKHDPLPGELRFLRWQRFDEVLSAAVPLIPDGMAVFEAEGERIVMFVEVDLGTEPLRIWKRKIEHYLALALNGESKSVCGSRRFRVLVMANSEHRLAGIRKVIAEQTEKVFWLTTLDQVDRDGFWAPMWLRPTGDQKQCLIRTMQKGGNME